MNAAWQKRVLLVAAAWNVIGGASALLDPAGHFAQLYTGALHLDDPIQRFFYQSVWINVIAWGVAYGIAAFVPAARLAALAAGGAGKVAYFLASASLFATGAATPALLAAGAVDLVFATAFALILYGNKGTVPLGRTRLRNPVLSGPG